MLPPTIANAEYCIRHDGSHSHRLCEYASSQCLKDVELRTTDVDTHLRETQHQSVFVSSQMLVLFSPWFRSLYEEIVSRDLCCCCNNDHQCQNNNKPRQSSVVVYLPDVEHRSLTAFASLIDDGRCVIASREHVTAALQLFVNVFRCVNTTTGSDTSSVELDNILIDDDDDDQGHQHKSPFSLSRVDVAATSSCQLDKSLGYHTSAAESAQNNGTTYSTTATNSSATCFVREPSEQRNSTSVEHNSGDITSHMHLKLEDYDDIDNDSRVNDLGDDDVVKADDILDDQEGCVVRTVAVSAALCGRKHNYSKVKKCADENEIDRQRTKRRCVERKRSRSSKTTAADHRKYGMRLPKKRRRNSSIIDAEKGVKNVVSVLKDMNRCGMCSDSFPDTDQLTRHTELVHSLETCENTNSDFKLSVQGSERKTHSTSGKCWMCDERVSSVSQVDHLRSEHSVKSSRNVLRCLRCMFTTKQRLVMRKHLLTTHNSGESAVKESSKEFHCNECDPIVSFKSKTLLRNHSRQTHSPKDDGGCVFECVICNELLKDVESKLADHIGEKHSTTTATTTVDKNDVAVRSCPFCEFSVPEDETSFEKHCNDLHPNETIRRCPLCRRDAFRSNDQLMQHGKKIHFKRKGVQCLLCDNQQLFYASSAELRTHLRATHPKGVELKCDKCEYVTNRRENFKIHQMKHLDIRKYSCPHCTYKAKHQMSLVQHIRLHTGEKPFLCHLCSYRATESGHLESHMRTHTGEKPFKCDKCTYSSANKSTLTRHMLTHSLEKPYKCNHDMCTFASTGRVSLIRHKAREHSAEKSFKCDQCSFAAAIRDDFNRHMRTHTNEKSFPCAQSCGARFSSKQLLQKHELSHNPVAALGLYITHAFTS